MQELQFITPVEAKEILGEHAIPIKGFSMIVYDTEQFMNVCIGIYARAFLGF